MNALELLKHGHRSIASATEEFTDAEWETPGLLGSWSARQVAAHLISYERVTEGALSTLLGFEAPYLRDLLGQMDELGDDFNDTFIAPYSDKRAV